MSILIAIYAASLIGAGAINWAKYRDAMASGEQTTMVEKVVHLYIVPLCPIANSCVVIGMIFEYFGLR